MLWGVRTHVMHLRGGKAFLPCDVFIITLQSDEKKNVPPRKVIHTANISYTLFPSLFICPSLNILCFHFFPLIIDNYLWLFVYLVPNIFSVYVRNFVICKKMMTVLRTVISRDKCGLSFLIFFISWKKTMKIFIYDGIHPDRCKISYMIIWIIIFLS